MMIKNVSLLSSIAAVGAVGIANPTKEPTSNPTNKPTFEAWSGTGCPKKWNEGSVYAAKELATVDGVVYQCSSQELLFIDKLCGLLEYKPGDALYWNVPWTRLGSCSGTIRPSSSPVFEDLADVGGCPEEFSETNKYMDGDLVSLDGIVLKCKEWPYSVYCNTEGYEPLGQKSDTAWAAVGHCDGTISPTKSPSFVSLSDHNGCPELYDSSTAYEANDKVSTDINGAFSIVWQCSKDVHLSRFCKQFEPGDKSNLGWTVIGHCDGTMSPTTAPNFMKLTEYGEGCPDEYAARNTYKSGDLVSYSASPDRKVVYECKAWPLEAYCNAGGLFAPGGVHESFGWSPKGWCDGTIAPTLSPIQLTDACEEEPWSLSDIAFYKEGDRVRKAANIYECRAWPYSLRCSDAYYEPESSAPWEEAWIHVGECEMIDEATASIQGILSINIGSRRRSLVSIDSLDEHEVDDLLTSAQDTVEGLACSGFSDDYICVVDITSLNDKSTTRRLRLGSQRELLPSLLSFNWIAQVTFQTLTNWSNARELANSASQAISTRLNTAISNNSLRSSLISNALTPAIQSINFGTMTSTNQPPQVQLRRSTSSRYREGGERCSKDDQCVSKNCKKGGGGTCGRRQKCCTPRLTSGKWCKDKKQCISNVCVKGGGVCPRWRKCCENPTPKPTPKPTPIPPPISSAHKSTSECSTKFDIDAARYSPLNYEGYGTGYRNLNILKPLQHYENGIVCYDDFLLPDPDGPTTAQYLAMFDKHFVEHCGTVYAAPPVGYRNFPYEHRGLFVVTDYDYDTKYSRACVKFDLVYHDEDIGQIVASKQFDPIEIISVSRTSIYGYYIHNGVYKRVQTKWGDAKDWTLTSDLGDGGLVSGVSAKGYLFTLWGKFDPDSSDPDDQNFNYASYTDDGIKCASAPAIIDDWTGFWSGSRGVYCPSVGGGKLWKSTWNPPPTGRTSEKLTWEPAKKIARLGPKTNIFGISNNDELLTLWDDTASSNPGVRSIAIDPHGEGSGVTHLFGIKALAGLDDEWGHGIFAINKWDIVYTVWWDGEWQAKEIGSADKIVFGTYKKKVYMLTGVMNTPTYYRIYRLDYVGGDSRYNKEQLRSGASY